MCRLHKNIIFCFVLDLQHSVYSVLVTLVIEVIVPIYYVAIIMIINYMVITIAGLSDPYCVLGVGRARTPKGSPRGSPKSSPTLLRRRRSSYEQGDIKKTQTLKATLRPRWNETFEL